MAKELATTIQDTGAPPAFLDDYASGDGVSTHAADNTVPFIYVLQGLSPQVNPRDDNYVEGAQVGDIWLRNAPTPIIKGMTGIHFQPCSFWQDVVEWVPRDDGGGIVSRHSIEPGTDVNKLLASLGKEVKDPKDENGKKMKWVTPDGKNELIHTRYHAGFVYGVGSGPLGYIIPFKSTGHTVSKTWMSIMSQKTAPNGRPYAGYTSMFELTTKQMKRGNNQWFVFSVKDLGFIQDRVDIERGKALYEAFASGALRASEEDMANSNRASEPADKDIPF